MAPKRMTPATSPGTMARLLKGSDIPVPPALVAEDEMQVPHADKNPNVEEGPPVGEELLWIEEDLLWRRTSCKG